MYVFVPDIFSHRKSHVLVIHFVFKGVLFDNFRYLSYISYFIKLMVLN